MVLYIASLKFAYYLTHRIPVQTIFDAHPSGCAAIAMSPDAKYIATISSNLPQVKLKCLTLISVKKAMCPLSKVLMSIEKNRTIWQD